MTSTSQRLWGMISKLSPPDSRSYKVKGAMPQHLKLVLATYLPNLWGFRDDVRKSRPSHNMSQLKKLMLMRVKMSRPTPKRRVFDRLQPSTSCQCPFVFRRIGKGKLLKPSVFHRLKKDEQPKPSVFARIKIGETSSSAPPSQKRDSAFSRLGKTNKVQSSIPSRMKRVSTLDVKVDNSLKVKRRVLILTHQGAKVSSKERTKK